MDVRFSPDGSSIIAKGDGNITLKFKWDDNPRSAGLAVGELTVRGQTFKQRGEKGEERKTIRVGKRANSGSPEVPTKKVYPIKFNDLNPANNPIEVSGNNKTNKNDALKLKDGSGSDTNAKIIIENVRGGTAQFTNDGRGIEVTGNCSIRITLDWDDKPKTAGKLLLIVLKLVVKYGHKEEKEELKLKQSISKEQKNLLQHQLN